MNAKRDIGNLYKPFIILDASILIAYFAREKDGNEPGFSRLAYDMNNGKVMPGILSIIYWEIGNWVCRDYPHRATEILSAVLLCNFQEHALDIAIANMAAKIVHKHKKVTFYDASYHALAIIKNGTFITADKAYYNATHKLGHIKLLKDY